MVLNPGDPINSIPNQNPENERESKEKSRPCWLPLAGLAVQLGPGVVVVVVVESTKGAVALVVMQNRDFVVSRPSSGR